MTESEMSLLVKYDPVTYVPTHAKGNAQHKDCEQGVLIGWKGDIARVLYCTSGRTIQGTHIENLVIG